ncbi:hypothetical protein SCP_0802770 [Sparassis crispa]|uniref:Uncharacterized protein n=1 Tax=Sparassis crispa TaxID=139825 RepID=A0A401GU47_9APHY|nr:hypothetical protein SCP_0802770 [Sparassis crispa]GBE85755.1 hypothetical protein SCP_0802770 [Sparassis crispa]
MAPPSFLPCVPWLTEYVLRRPQVKQANECVPAYGLIGVIEKEMVLLADPARPIMRTAEGTLLRKATLSVYEKDIDKLWLAAASVPRL